MPRTVTIRQSLLRSIVALILLLAGGIFATTFWGARRAVESLSRSLMGQKLDETEQRLRRFFDPVERELQVARDWADAGLLTTDDPDANRRLLVPLMQRTRQVSSVMVADDRGHEIMVLRLGERWSLREVRRDEWGARARWTRWTEDDSAAETSTEDLDYDPRRRPWFEEAVGRRADLGPATPREQLVNWTTPYTFFTTRDPGMTASVAFAADGGRTVVIGFDMRLNDISAFTTAMRVSERGGAVVLTGDGRVIGLPRDERYMDAADRREHYLKRPEDLGWTLAGDAAAAFGARPVGGDEATRFRSEGQWWWGQGRPFALSPERALWIGVVVPERDLIGNLTMLRAWILALTTIVLALAIARAFALARRYGDPVERLVAETDRMGRGDLGPGRPIATRIREFRRLARAHERMRDGLRSLLKLERDLQVARQIQQSTLPARLPAVAGFDIAAWSEPAEETGGDIYDVIGISGGSNGSAGRAARRIDPPDGAERALLLLADATGHGIGPALSATQIRAMLRMAVRTWTELPLLVSAMNEQLHADLPEGRFITAFLGTIDGATGQLRTFSAGQGPLLLYVAARAAFAEIATDAVPFGILPEMDTPAPEPITMAPGDLLAILSDGIFEAMDPEGRQLGTDRVQAVLRDAAGRPAEEIIERLRQEVAAFTSGRAADDDRTAILVMRT